MEITFQKSEINFLSVLRKRVNGYFQEKGIKSTGDYSLILKSAILMFAFLCCYLFPIVFQQLPVYAYIINYTIFGIVLALIGFNIMHDGSHDSFSSKKSINKITAYSLNILGGNAQFWKQKHVVNHHTFTNIETLDDDIDLKPFLRLHPDQEYKWYHKYQHFYAGILYCMTYVFWIHYRDYKKYFTKKIAEVTEMADLTTEDHIVFWISKVVHLILFVVIPMFFVSWSMVIWGYLLMALVCGDDRNGMVNSPNPDNSQFCSWQ
jgi:linoleoyl-CoA desaturase